jgi:hypothetical protein
METSLQKALDTLFARWVAKSEAEYAALARLYQLACENQDGMVKKSDEGAKFSTGSLRPFRGPDSKSRKETL